MSTVAETAPFPSDGKVLIIGLSKDSDILLRHGDRVLFQEDPSAIQREEQFPLDPEIKAVCLHGLLPGEITRISGIAGKKGLMVSPTGGLLGLKKTLERWGVPTIGNGANQVSLRGTPKPVLPPPDPPDSQKGEDMAEKHGERMEFIRLNRSPVAAAVTDEAHQIYLRAQKAGKSWSLSSIKSGLYALNAKSGAGKRKSRQKKVGKPARAEKGTRGKGKASTGLAAEIKQLMQGASRRHQASPSGRARKHPPQEGERPRHNTTIGSQDTSPGGEASRQEVISSHGALSGAFFIAKLFFIFQIFLAL